MRGLRPPEMRRRPLVYSILYGTPSSPPAGRSPRTRLASLAARGLTRGPHSPKCVEGLFCELRSGVIPRSPHPRSPLASVLRASCAFLCTPSRAPWFVHKKVVTPSRGRALSTIPAPLEQGKPPSLYPASPGRCGVRVALPTVFSCALPVTPLFAPSSLVEALLLLLKVLLSLLKVLLLLLEVLIPLLAHESLLPSGSRSCQRTLPPETGGQSWPGRGSDAPAQPPKRSLSVFALSPVG